MAALPQATWDPAVNDHEANHSKTDPTWFGIAILGLALAGLLARPANARLRQAAAPEGQPRSPVGRGKDPSAIMAPVSHAPGFIGLAGALAERLGRDNVTLVAAGIAFYVMLAIFPALAALVSLYGLVGNPEDVAQRIDDYGTLLPPEALKLITDGLRSFAQKTGSQLSLALVTSIALALWSARAGVSAVMTGLNIAYEEAEKRSYIVQNVVALALTFAGIIFAVVVILALAVIPIILRVLALDGVTAAIADLVRWPALAFILVVSLAVVYRFAPSRSHPRWRWITWGSGIATLLWLLGSFLFSLYVSRFGSYDATYGSLGAGVILLLWFWVSALVLLFGAEIDAELDTRVAGVGPPIERARQAR